MQNGVIKMFDQIKGFGFILSDEGDEIYFNRDNIHPKYKNLLIKENERVAFDLKRGMKGDQAANVRLL
jgi:CspA family cold shock protein